MFSPYYAFARRSGAGDPLHHCALNVALYGAGGKRWSLTERGSGALQRDTDSLTIGPSGLAWDGSALTIHIDEVTVPLPSRIRGTVRLYPTALTRHGVELDAAGRHRWWPIAPCARIEVELERPARRWVGAGYLDTNSGDEPMERAFTTWDWSRASLRDGTAIVYDVRRRDGDRMALALRCDRSGAVEPFAVPPATPLPPTLWRVARGTRADAGHPVMVQETLEDAPFYSRSIVRQHLLGEPVTAMHESLSLDRFAQPWVQLMLPFRMPRRR